MRNQRRAWRGITRKQLWERIAALPQPHLKCAIDALTMIWNSVKWPLELPKTDPKFTFSMTPTFFRNWHQVKLALLKSISTGTFIDTQFYAFNAIDNDLLLDLRPLFTSSIVIEEWGAAIVMREWEGSSKFI